jgi:hypothetical protein
MQASKSLASSSRTWFSTGINKTGFFDVIDPVVLLSHVYPKGLNRIRTVLNWYLPQGSAALQVKPLFAVFSVVETDFATDKILKHLTKLKSKDR